MMREPQSWWVTRTTAVNLTLVVLLSLLVFWSSLRSRLADNLAGLAGVQLALQRRAHRRRGAQRRVDLRRDVLLLAVVDVAAGVTNWLFDVSDLVALLIESETAKFA